jgi:hypothetical protein
MVRDALWSQNETRIRAVFAACERFLESDGAQFSRGATILAATVVYGGPPEQLTARFSGIAASLLQRFRARSHGMTPPSPAMNETIPASLSRMGGVIASVLCGDVPRGADILSEERRLALVNSISTLAAADGESSFAAHVLSAVALGGSPDQAAREALNSLVCGGPTVSLRITALAQLGKTSSIAEIEATMLRAAVSSPRLIHDERLQIAYLAAVDNARLLAPEHGLAACDVFSRILSSRDSDMRSQQRFVLRTLANAPLPQLESSLHSLVATHQSAAIRQLGRMAIEALAQSDR